MLTIVGIDPGLASTGVAVIQGANATIEKYSYGTIHTSPRQATPDRLYHIHTKLVAFFEAQMPDFIVVEDVFSLEKYPISGITLGKVSGVVMVAGCQMNIPVTEIPVRVAKQILTGSGSADKRQLEESVRRRLNHPSPIKPWHAADALALAMAGLYRWEKLWPAGK